MKTIKDAVKEFNGVWPSDLAGTDYWFTGEIMHYVIESKGNRICTREEFEAYAKEQKQSDKPVYTQEMADNGELPPVGSEILLVCKYDSEPHNNNGVVLFSSVDNCVMHNGNGEYCYKMSDYTYCAIETRTDEEKLIDDVAKQLNQSYINATDIFKNGSYFKAYAKRLLIKLDIKLK